MIKDILENLDNEVLTDEMKSTISEAFDSAIAQKMDETFEVKVAERAAELVEAKNEEYSSYLSEKEEEYQNEANEFKDSLVNTIDAYLAQFTEEMVSSSLSEMQQDIENVKAKAIIESFETLGLEVKTSEVDTKIDERDSSVESIKEELNKSVNENIELKKTILTMKKQAIVERESAELTELQKDKFTKLVEALGDIEDVESFESKIKVVVESVSEKIEETEVVVESKKEETKSVSFSKRFL